MIVEAQENDGYVGEQLNIRLFEKIQDIETKRKKEQKQEAKKAKQKTKGEKKTQLAQGTAVGVNKKVRGPISLEEEERAIHEAYQVLLTEHHKRKATRKRRAIQNLKRAEKIEESQEIYQDAFSHIRKKSSTTPLLSK